MRIAVVTGGHWFPEQEFDALFLGMTGIQFVREELADFVADDERDAYDAVVFYNYHQETPDEETREAVLRIAEDGRGIVVLHHGLLAFPEWDVWRRVCGIDIYSAGHANDVDLLVHVDDSTHPITAGMADFKMVDETYLMGDPDDDCHVLLSVDHPDSMSRLAWARTYGDSRVFCIQCGHDGKAYATPEFQEILARGIRWSGGA